MTFANDACRLRAAEGVSPNDRRLLGSRVVWHEHIIKGFRASTVSPDRQHRRSRPASLLETPKAEANRFPSVDPLDNEIERAPPIERSPQRTQRTQS
jgi:hypothetical protein